MYMVRCGGHDTHGHTLVVSLSQNAVGVAAMTIHYVHKERRDQSLVAYCRHVHVRT